MVGNLTIVAVQRLLGKLRDMINSSDVKARLYDANMNLTKEFYELTNLTVEVEDDFVYLYIRIIDLSEAEYKFKYMYLIGKDGEERFHVVIHPFLEEYEKKRNMVVDIKVKTGITGCVSG